MKIFNRFGAAALCLASLTAPTAVQAGSSQGLVTQPLVNAYSTDGYFAFYAGTIVNSQPCQKYGWVANTGTAAGRAVMATVLAAYAQGKQVGVVGRNNCDFIGDRETVLYMYIID